MSKIHNCETCGQKVVVGGEGTTHYYIGKESELAQQAMLEEVIEIIESDVKYKFSVRDFEFGSGIINKLRKKYGVKG